MPDGSSITVVPAMTTTYVVSGTTDGCTSEGSVQVTVNPLPVVDAGADQLVCENTQVTLSATGAVSYLWDNGVHNNIPFTIDTTHTYTVIGIDQNGCKATDSVTVTTKSTPNVAFVADTLMGCSPLHVTFSNQSTEVNSATTYVWSYGDGSTSTGTNGAHDYYMDSCYDITLTAYNGDTITGCSSSMTLNDYICVYPTPEASFTASTYDITNVMNEVNFNNTSQNATSYEWNFGDPLGTTSNAVNPKFTYDPNQIMNHAVVLVAKNDAGCTDTAMAIINMKQEIVFYVPNAFTPDGDEYNNTFKPVFANGFDGFDYTMMIFDRWGELIFETHDTKVGWDGTYSVTGKVCQDGVYVWKIVVKTADVDNRIEKTGHVTLIR